MRSTAARPRATLLTAVLALAVGLALGTTAPAQAAPRSEAGETWTVPGNAVLKISGRGYGHGHGMSQHGAEGAARQGLTYRQINEFYYPGTTWGTVKGKVKVHITRDTTDDVVVDARRNLSVRDVATKRTWSLPERPWIKQWRLKTNKRNRTVVQRRGKADGKGSRKWRRWRAFSGDGEFFARGGITLVTPSGKVTYRGKLRAASPSPGSRARDTVNIVSLENYLKGVVPLEIPASWSPEAVRAQSVAARTYAAFERSSPLARHYQICDTTSCQVYGGKSAEHPLSNAAVKATKREVLTADGEPAFTQFSSSNGGWSSAGSRPYLTAQEDPYDGWSGNSVHTWSTTVTDRRIETAWPRIGDLRQIVVTERDGNGEWGGRVRSMTLVGKAGRVEVTGDEVRGALGLRSSWFTFDVVPRNNRRTF